MIFIYPEQNNPETALWIDLLSPTKQEENELEKSLGLKIPTREEMSEIELSSRLYKEDDTLFMTATMLAQSDSNEPKYDAVTFILTEKQLITIRYIEPQAFRLFISHVRKKLQTYTQPASLLIECLDATVDRLADILEIIGHRLDTYSKVIFDPSYEVDPTKKLDYQQLLQQTGANGDLNSKTRESLVSFNRLITYLIQNIGNKLDSDAHQHLTTLSKDISSLSDHANFLSSKINFLLDATLGMVSIEQNKIIKIFSVAAVIFLPPTLIASIYGMNFHFMPELSWKGGYFFAIFLMLLSAWLPYKYFKRRKWL
ncbi:MAG: magnesium/cobalt transporter CorA [Gammaproteobacteria bacterium]|nr:magnesium/cobalt transporter CorA [Gammaproteobacteria bacterium]